MQRNRELLFATIWGVALVALMPRPAYAYIDPGVGLLVLQGVIASAAGAIFFARRMITQAVRALFGKGGTPSSEPKRPE